MRQRHRKLSNVAPRHHFSLLARGLEWRLRCQMTEYDCTIRLRPSRQLSVHGENGTWVEALGAFRDVPQIGINMVKLG